MRVPAFLRAAPGVCVAIVACAPPPPADPAIVDQWADATRMVVEGSDPQRGARVAALAAVAMYEALAAADTTGFRSLAGQLNGLWSVPSPVPRTIDGAISAAEAQRVILDSLAATDPVTRQRLDSLARAQIDSRRGAGVAEEIAEHSVAFGQALGRAVLALASGEAQRTLVLRHPQECAFRVAGRSTGIVLQGDTASMAPVIASITAAAEARVLKALATADSLAATARATGAAGCPHAIVRGRLRTRVASP